jgi:hypothetical protein
MLNAHPMRSRKSMLETLLRRLDMVRLTVGALAMLAFGCSGLIDNGGGEGLTPEEAEARRLFLAKALPALADCRACHEVAPADTPNIDFLAGDSDLAKRDTLVAYEPAVINLDAVGSSRLVTKGQHQGPPLNAVQTSDILEWLAAERIAAGITGGGDPALRTPPVMLQLCQANQLPDPVTPNPLCPIMSIPLDTVGEGSAGSRIEFVVNSISGGLYFTNMKIVPGATGVFAEHPLFFALGTDGVTAPRNEGDGCELLDEASGEIACADTLDRFFNVKLNLEQTAPVEDQFLAGGAHTFTNFRQTDYVSIQFKALKIFTPEDPGPGVTTGCKKVDPEFLAARVALTANVGAGVGGQNCAQCHAGQNGNATSAVNMTLVGNGDPLMAATGCNQIRTRINFQGIDNSSLFLAVAPNNNNHPVRFASQADFDQFKSILNPWIVAERDAP